MKASFIVGIVLFVVIISVVAGSIGLIPAPDYAHTEPTMPGVLFIFEWAWNTLVFFFQLITFQIPGVPLVVNMLITFPLMAGLLYIIVRAIRGGG